MEYIEIIGYVASGFIMGSFLVNNNLRLLRSINGIGCFLFAIYGFMTGSIPVIITNGFICLIQVYYLFIHKTKT